MKSLIYSVLLVVILGAPVAFGQTGIGPNITFAPPPCPVSSFCSTSGWARA